MDCIQEKDILINVTRNIIRKLKRRTAVGQFLGFYDLLGYFEVIICEIYVLYVRSYTIFNTAT